MKIENLKPAYIAIVALSLIALFPLPYGYYTFLRIAVTAFAGLTAYLSFQSGKRDWFSWACVGIAILFNPFIPIHLDREVWMFMNVSVAGLFGFAMFKKT